MCLFPRANVPIALMLAAIGSMSEIAISDEVTFLGPSPYLSRADSPFDLSVLGTEFFLEDFETDSDWPVGLTVSMHQINGPSRG